MKKTNLVIISLLIPLFLNSCGTVAEGLGGSKKKGNQEFLVEKKSRLSIPPNFEELPVPSDKKTDEQSQKNNIESLIKENNSNDENLETDESNKDFEQSILDKIKNN